MQTNKQQQEHLVRFRLTYDEIALSVPLELPEKDIARKKE